MFNKEKIESLQRQIDWQDKQMRDMCGDIIRLTVKLERLMQHLGVEEVHVNEVKIIKRKHE